jgi:hypothetical protein
MLSIEKPTSVSDCVGAKSSKPKSSSDDSRTKRKDIIRYLKHLKCFTGMTVLVQNHLNQNLHQMILEQKEKTSLDI